MQSIFLNHKKIRAEIIQEFLNGKRAFCFSSGNAAYALKKAGVNLIAVSPKDALNAQKFVPPEEAERYFQAFNATSGCLPVFLVERIAKKIKRKCGRFNPGKNRLFVPFGSGELIMAFSFFFPLNRIVAVTSDYPPLRQDGTGHLASLIQNNCLKVVVVNGAKSIKDIKKRIAKELGENDIFIDTSPADHYHL